MRLFLGPGMPLFSVTALMWPPRGPWKGAELFLQMKAPREQQEGCKQSPASDFNLSSGDPVQTNLSPARPRSLRYGKFFTEHFSKSGGVSGERRDEAKAEAGWLLSGRGQAGNAYLL